MEAIAALITCGVKEPGVPSFGGGRKGLFVVLCAWFWRIKTAARAGKPTDQRPPRWEKTKPVMAQSKPL